MYVCPSVCLPAGFREVAETVQGRTSRGLRGDISWVDLRNATRQTEQIEDEKNIRNVQVVREG